jgi:hypothetical protein
MLCQHRAINRVAAMGSVATQCMRFFETSGTIFFLAATPWR